MLSQKSKLTDDRAFQFGALSTIVAAIGCLSTHIVVILGISSATAILGNIEHGLLVAAVTFAALTVYAVRRHRRVQQTTTSRRSR